MARAIVMPEPEKVALTDVQLAPLGEGQLRLRTRCTLLSTGTETTILHRRFAAGTHWARMFARPRPLGYSCVAEVTEVAEGAGGRPGTGDAGAAGSGGAAGADSAAGFTVGDRVVAQLGHVSEHVVDADRCTLVPDEVSDQDAAWFALAKVAYVAADICGAGLGTRTLVMGAGPVGQMAIRWLAAQGAYVVTAERRTTVRTALARSGGAAEVRRTDQLPGLAPVSARPPEPRSPEPRPPEPRPPESRPEVPGSDPAGSDVPGSEFVGPGSREFEVVVDATGNPEAFAGALRVVADHGRVVILGDVGDPSEQRLTSDLITRGLSVVGAHGNHVRGERDHQVRKLFFRLVSSGRFPMDGLVTHRFAPEQCAEAYALVERDRANSLGVIFDWRA